MTEFDRIEKEIHYSGTCYLVCKHYELEDFEAALAEEIAYARAHGAKELRLGMKDAAFMRRKRVIAGGCRFLYYSDFDILIKHVSPEAGPMLRLKRMNADNAPLFAALYNESFLSVPNGATVDAPEIERMLFGTCEAGFLMWGGEPMGVYELDFSEEIPEIAAVAIRPDRQGEGYGRMALRSLERRILNKGHAQVELLVATANAGAYRLYDDMGYKKQRRMSRWFCTKLEG